MLRKQLLDNSSHAVIGIVCKAYLPSLQEMANAVTQRALIDTAPAAG